MLFQVVTVEQCCNNMLTILFIVGRTTLFTPVDINLQQVVDFLSFSLRLSVLRHVMYTIVDRYDNERETWSKSNSQ
jgi:hypothetical protein